METKKSSFQFERPILLNLIYNENNDFELKDEVEIKVDLETNVDTRENNADVYVVLKTIGDNLPFYIEVEMYSKFVWNEEMKNENLQNILETNAALVLVSYIRNIVANITSSSRYPTWHIPFLDLRKEKDN